MKILPKKGVVAISPPDFDSVFLIFALEHVLRGGVCAYVYAPAENHYDIRDLRVISQLCAGLGVPLIVKGDVDAARAFGAAGLLVEIGRTDISSLRQELPEETALWVECEGDAKHIEAILSEGADIVLANRSLASAHDLLEESEILSGRCVLRVEASLDEVSELPKELQVVGLSGELFYADDPLTTTNNYKQELLGDKCEKHHSAKGSSFKFN